VSIEINQESLQSEYLIDDFDITTVSIIVHFSDDTSEIVFLNSNMLSSDDLAKLNINGTQSITINHQGFTCTFDLKLIEQDVNILLEQLYELGVTEGLIEGTYQEWLDSIKGEDGVGILSVSLNLNGELVIELTDGTSRNLGSILGDDGVSIESTSINTEGELIIHFSDGSTENAGYILGEDGLSVFEVYQRNHPFFTGSEQEWLESLIGENGLTPTIGENGNWWIGNLDTLISASPSLQTDEATDGLYYVMTTVSGVTGFEVSNYQGTSTSIVIPNYVSGMPVVSIGASAFATVTNILEVNIPANVLRLSNRAFYNNQLLERVSFDGNSKLTHIYNEVFYNNYKLKNISLPASLTYIGASAFYGTSAQYNIFIGSNVSYVGANAFYNSSSTGASIYLSSLVKPELWATNWTNKNVLQIHRGVNITSDLFVYNLTDTNTVRVVGYLGISTEITIPTQIANKNVTHIGSFSFAYNQNVRGIRVGTNITTIDTYAFYKMINLKYLVIPESVTSIGALAFNVVYESSTDVNFTQVYYEKAKPDVCDWTCFDNWEGFTISAVHWNTDIDNFYVSGNLQYLVVSNKITITGYMYNETSIDIPEQINGKDVTKIDKFAFVASAFASITLPDGLLEIGAVSFAYQYNLQSFIIPDSVTIIGEYAFHDNDLVELIYIPNSVIIIGANAFQYSGNIMILAEIDAKPTGWDSTWNSSNLTVYWNVDSYVETDDYIAVITGLNAKIVKYIGNDTVIIIPSRIGIYTVTTIATNAFKINTSSTIYKIVIPSSVQYIEYRAFYNLYSYGGSYLKLYSEADSKPTSWDSSWYYTATPYWRSQWALDGNGIPQLI